MRQNNNLNLLMVDDNQLYAEDLVSLLKQYYDKVDLGFLDDKDELIKTLRHSWDVLIFGKAYDMDFTDIVGIVQDYAPDLPLICLSKNNNTEDADKELPNTIDSKIVKTLYAGNQSQIIIATCILHRCVEVKRELEEMRNVLSEAEQRANILIKNSKSAVAYIDEGIHIFCNDPYAEMFGFEHPDNLIGVPIIDLIVGGDNVKGFKQFLRRFSKGNRKQVEFKFESKRKNGSTFEAKLQLATATFDGNLVTQVIIQPEMESNAIELAQKLAEVERRDNLTGLLNRQGFESRFMQVYQTAKEGGESAVLLYVTIDDIGKINSTAGIKGVDATVKRIAYCLDEGFEVGVVSRVADSGFTILVPDVRNESEVEEKANEIREKIADMLIEVDARTVTTTVTMGGVMVESSSPPATELIDRAVEMANEAFVASDNKGNVVKFYDASQHAGSDDAALAEHLQTALKEGKFEIFYQPIYDIETDSSEFFEAYLHLPIADGSYLTPNQFASIAKEFDLIEKIDRWLLINACKQLNQTRKRMPNAKILVQLTSQSLANQQLAGIIGQLIKAIGGANDALTVQFFEQDLVNYMAVAKRQFSALKANGCRVCIKDFGGTSKTIEMIDYLEPSMTRLARSYVTDLNNDENMETVKTLVSKASERSMAVLMPYIEDAATMSVAWSVGARYLQGHYLQEPSPQMIVDDGGA